MSCDMFIKIKLFLTRDNLELIIIKCLFYIKIMAFLLSKILDKIYNFCQNPNFALNF